MWYSLTILDVVLLIICVEATTEIVIKAKVFEPLRSRVNKLRKNRGWLEYVTTPLFCAHCFSVWAALFYTTLFLVLPHYLGVEGLRQAVWFFMAILFFHRMANYLHMVVDRVDKFYSTKE